jgi:hypothetical protein
VPRSQALPGNESSARLCLGARPCVPLSTLRRLASGSGRRLLAAAEAEPRGIAFPGEAWVRGNGHLPDYHGFIMKPLPRMPMSPVGTPMFCRARE